MPEITITMLGGTSSGKTLYLLGLYGVMSAGLEGYTLHARNLDDDLAMTAMWDAFVDKGQLPPATNDFVAYRMAFRQAFTGLIDINWLDYRGNVMNGDGTPEEIQQLVAQLAVSDSVYLTIDGDVLARPVDNFLEMRRRTRAGLMTRYLAAAAEERGGPLPSVVVLITKADLLFANAATPDEALDEAVAAVQQLVPAAFYEGTTTMVCPVSLGDLGPEDDNSRIDPARISPRWVQKPIVFSLVRYFQAERTRDAAALVDAQSAVRMEERRLAELRGSVFGRFRPGRRRELAERIEGAHQRFGDYRGRVEFAVDRDRRLQGQLEGPRFFVDGAETEFVHG